MNPVCLWLCGLGLVLAVAQAEAQGPKTVTVPTRTAVVQPVTTGDAQEGVQEVIRRRREYPHHLFAPGATKPVPKSLQQILDEASGSPAAAAAVEDTMRIAWIRVEFAGNSVPGRFTGSGRFLLEEDPLVPVDPPPHNRAFFEAHGEALQRYYFTQSYETLRMVSTVYPPGENAAYLLDDPADYGPWDVGQDIAIINRAERFVTDAILAASESGDIDFSQVDGVIVVHAGSDFQGDVNFDSPYDIPSFTLTFATPLNTPSGEVPRVSVVPEMTSQDDLLGALNGVVAHEVGHLLDLPDLYNIYNGAPQVGWFSLMDSGENLVVVVGDAEGNILYEARGTTPTSLDPWCKLQAFPAAARRIFVGSSSAPFANGIWEADLTAGITTPGIPLVLAGDSEYFLIENRVLDLDGNGVSFTDQDSTTGVFLGPLEDEDFPGGRGEIEYDWPLPGNGGVAIWHIDDDTIALGLSVQGGVNLNLNLRGVALEEADGIWDIGYNTGFPFGHPNDLYFLGNNTLFDPFTTPSSWANSGAYTGVTIQIEDAPQAAMTVRVSNPLLRPDWPLSVGSGFQLEQMTVTRAAGAPLPVAAYGHAEAEEYGVFVPTTAFGGFHDQPLTGPLTADDDFDYGGHTGLLIAAVDVKGQLVAWNEDAERLFAVGRDFSGRPLVVTDAEASRDLLLVEAESGVEAWDATGSLRRQWEFNALPRESNPALYPDGSFAVAFAGTVCRFEFEGAAPAQAVSLPEPIHRLILGRSGDGTERVFALGDTRLFVIGEDWQVQYRWQLPEALAAEAIVVDLDHDGHPEVALADTAGTIWVRNPDGSPAVGWPQATEERWTHLRSADLDGDGRLDLAGAAESGLLYGFAGDGTAVPAFPRPLASGPTRSLELHAADGGLLVFGVTGSQLWSWNMPGSSLPPGSWPAPGAGSGNYLATPAVEDGGPDLGPTDFLVYPNPSLGSDVELRFQLEDGETFELSIVDPAGRWVDADLDLRGSPRLGENAVQWLVGDVAPGLYHCLLKRSGPEGTRLDKVKVAVLQ